MQISGNATSLLTSTQSFEILKEKERNNSKKQTKQQPKKKKKSITVVIATQCVLVWRVVVFYVGLC